MNSLRKIISSIELFPDVLLVFVPAAIFIRFIPSFKNETLLFFVSCLAIIPLAGWMGRATEQLAKKTGQGLGGLLNATFGNAAELIIALMALSKGLTGVVKASITGSIIGNLLMVLGASIVAGGLKFNVQKFNQTAVRASATSLMLAAVALIIPTVFHQVTEGHPGALRAGSEQKLSLAIAIVLIATYGFILLFTLKTHKDLYVGEENHSHDADEVEWSKAESIGVLLVSTLIVSLISEFLVGSIEVAQRSLGLTEVFVGVIIVAIIGNAAEHSTALMVAMKNKMDLSLSIAIGSSLQIALFVAPVLVFSSYLMGTPMDLQFTLPEIVAVVVSVWVVGQICGDGESNWLEGVQLLSVYTILAILFFFLPSTH
jgi:Ca2+:H+ antiporter